MEVVTKALETIGTAAGELFVSKLREAEENNTRPFRESAAEEFLSERNLILTARIAKLERAVGTTAQLDDMITDEFLFLQQNYQFEAMRETRKERRRMLAHAAAAAADLDATPLQRSRTERVLRTLEPEDVRVLGWAHAHRLERESQDASAVSRLGVERHRIAERYIDSFDALQTTGCVRVGSGMPYRSDPTLTLTPLGELVVRMLALYVSIPR